MDERGIKVHADFTSADASAGAPLAFVESMRPATARAIAANEVLVITDISGTIGAAITAAIHNGNGDTQNNRVVRGAFAANAHFEKQFAMGYECPKGNTPAVKTSAIGQVDFQVEGFIIH